MGFFSHDANDDVVVSASFPESNPFGLVVNGERNGLSLHLENTGSKSYTLVSAAASYHDPSNYWALVKNTSTTKYNVPLVGGANFSAPFSMHSEFRPQELGVTVWVNVLEPSTDSMYQITALNQTVSIVEPTGSWLDPQLGFLYLVLTAALFGGAYAIYKSFFESQTKGKKSTGTKRVKAVTVPTEKKSYPVVKPYEEEWIPEQHLKNRASKLKKRESGVSGGEDLTTSGGEATSGPDSAPEGRSPRKGKGKKA